MTPAAAKLLMCVCAGSTGAVMVPAVHKARSAMHRPAAQHASAHVPAGGVMASPCAPIASAAPLLAPIGDMPAQAGLASLGQLADGGAPNGFGGYPGGDSGMFDGGEGGYFGGGSGGGGIGGGGGGGGGTGGGTPGTPPVGPVLGTVPEPASWAMMLSGFGAMGGAMRWQRRSTAQA